MGKEAGGIDEVWTHPFRLLRDYRAGIVVGDTLAWLDEMSARLEIRPEGLTRTWSTPAGALTEVLFTAPDEPAIVVHYALSGTGHGKLVVKFRSDLRQMWPYDAPATGALGYAVDSSGSRPTLMVRDGPGLSWGMFGADRAALAHLAGAFDSVWWNAGAFGGAPTGLNQVWYAAEYELGEEAPINIVMTGGSDGGPRTASRFTDILANPGAVHSAERRSLEELLARSVSIDSPDDEFDKLFKWAIVGTDRFLVNTPGIGKGLLAGYSTTARGWDGAQKISGRPGYAWYFGRDAAWSGFAIDDYGDFAAVRAEIELMQKYQDASGKIFHEISTSGSVHYDAADATPLYVQLAAHYLRASGDTAFLRASWRNINRAMQYLHSTDTDHDRLIENTNQGHGWVEGGALYPVHTEFYLAGAWAKALVDAAYIASKLHDGTWNKLYGNLGKGVREILNRDFWNPQTKFFNLGKNADGTYNTEPTVLPATVMYYNLLDDEKVKPVLEQYAGAGFTTDWGVRIVSSSSPLFNPQGYHYGSVWPLFTGWTALAEYEYGNSTQGFTHILNNLYIKNHWALGFVEEVMSGSVYSPSGVCPHQCWSETNILHPAITGMIGWKPDAPEHAAGLFPRFPAQWDSVKVRNLRAGRSLVDLEMARDAKRTVWSFSARGEEKLTLSFAPEIPDGMEIHRLLLDGKEIPVPAGRRRGLIDPPLSILFPGVLSGGEGGGTGHTLVIEHTGGIAVVPAMPRPEPGDSSTGHRIVSEEMRDGVYEIKIEGRAGTNAEIEVRTFDRTLGGVENAAILGEGKKGVYRLRVEFPAGPAPYVAVTVKARTN
jgi:glycogen debranching enzyme